ncbi:DUF6308 family protein [Asanoa iriomotensis]|uniref:Uncharacterized protein n=1 Tax=Asanoa iriomotensis TaxID=234613 RepID=A0ABQ4BYN1_9ACTN|nr:DUF6308 family protein [Asanoa iriomotensis]GIF55632.1 hypothetical protein Air01nite_17270 [Asanoa iriomotensis]
MDVNGNVPPIEVAGWKVDDPLSVVTDYCRAHAGTLRRYDFVAGTAATLTPDLVAATTAIDGRIGRPQAAWLLTKSAGAPWDEVDREAVLRDADPMVAAGLYDNAERLYAHFHRDHPRDIDHAKISKCLHLTRPALFPILDRRLLQLYRQPARAAARDLTDRRRDRTWPRRAYWAAIRADLLLAADALDELRTAMRAEGDLAAEAAGKLGDVRLLDILCWSMGSRY